MVFQSFNLFPHMSVIDNVAIGPRKVLGADKSDARREGLDMLTRLGLAERAEPTPTSCPAASSSGWRSPGRWR